MSFVRPIRIVPGGVGRLLIAPLRLLVGGLVFALGTATHCMSSRAGNRDNAQYHAVTCLVHGIVGFVTGTFTILNASNVVDLIPVVAFGSAFAQLLVMDWSMQIEIKLQSLMDPPKEQSKKIQAA